MGMTGRIGMSCIKIRADEEKFRIIFS